jgi:hypothetical protein
MTMTRRKDSTFELHICGRSISGWSCNEILPCLICLKDTTCFRLKFGGKMSYFDCHRCFLPLDHPFRLDSNTFKKENIVLEGPPRHLSSLKIADMLDNWVPKENRMSL